MQSEALYLKKNKQTKKKSHMLPRHYENYCDVSSVSDHYLKASAVSFTKKK